MKIVSHATMGLMGSTCGLEATPLNYWLRGVVLRLRYVVLRDQQNLLLLVGIQRTLQYFWSELRISLHWEGCMLIYFALSS